MKTRKFVAIITAVIMLLSIGTVNAFAAEPTLSDSRIDAAIQAYCSSDDFTLEGLQAKFPEFYAACQREYAQDALMIQSIQNNLNAMLVAGQQIAATDVKCNEAVYRDSTLGSYGDILVSLAVDSGSFGFAGHAAIVSDSRYETIESYAKSFSPIDKDGVQIYDNDWGATAGSLLLRPYGATTSDYYGAVDFAETKIGLPYNWNFLNKNATDKYYCSQLVWQAWLDVGINIETGSIPNAIIAPADLVNSSNTYLVAHIT